MRHRLSRGDICTGSVSLIGHSNGEETHEEAIRPLVLHGIAGVGKSAIMAQAAKQYCSLEGWTSALAVIRFAGASTQCETLEQMLQSVREQICILVGLPITSVYEVNSHIIIIIIIIVLIIIIIIITKWW